jgi:hypothetical protein
LSAQILKFPRRDRSAVLVERVEGDWLATYDGQSFPFASREAALQAALEIADQVNAPTIVVKATADRGAGGRAKSSHSRPRARWRSEWQSGACTWSRPLSK